MCLGTKLLRDVNSKTEDVCVHICIYAGTLTYTYAHARLIAGDSGRGGALATHGFAYFLGLKKAP